jgi:glycosyltransferase involved in cell wall biosynthesis
MITMFKNESRVLKRMLESCKPYVDYYVMQNNGSTDGSDEIAKQFLIENGLSGEVYEVEEGWIGFGWNRDHLIQYCQKSDHGCDWILKMDCDEILEVDDSFDWSLLDDTTTHAYHIPCVGGTTVYYRAWMWNAKMPWRFNHDPCHETIYCDIPEINYNYNRVDLPLSFRHLGSNEGQSWSNPTKFISDSLILEEKMIKENSFHSDIYHFWYIGKSYYDAYKCHVFPLGETQQKHYAERSIYYFEEFLKTLVNLNMPMGEDAYLTKLYIAESYNFIGNEEKCVINYEEAEYYAPDRNDHLIGLANFYQEKKLFEKMIVYTSKMLQPERTNPFPRCSNFIDTSMYWDSPTQRIQQLHEIALIGIQDSPTLFYINKLPQKRLFVIDNFYINPDEIRNFALTKVEYKQDLNWYKGYRSTTSYHPPGIVNAFEKVINQPIKSFPIGTVNGCFQIMVASDTQVYHYDEQQWAAMIYLSPNAPPESGTRLHKSRQGIFRHSTDAGINEYFSGDFYDSTKWDVVDCAANFYNRLVIMDAKCVHSAGPYFGKDFDTGRLTHLFFFD